MKIAEDSERAALDEYEPGWVEQGYRVIRHPSPSQVPKFLGHFQPDALAVGRQPNLVVEVLRKGSRNADEKVRRLKSLVEGQPEWRLEIIYSGEVESEVVSTSADSISELLVNARKLCLEEPRASLLLTWAALEALARRLDPKNASRPQSPGRVIELLAGAGHIAPSEAEAMRAGANLRNRLIHGDLSIHPAAVDVQRLITIAENLLTKVKNNKN